MTWLRLGATLLAMSFVAAVFQPNGDTVYGNKTVLILDSWIERTAFWLGLLFIAGYILDQIFAHDRRR
ncbi:MAG: hypothetical protein JO074_06125 [Frankiales bacterium]|nr:hypothetical protein [Frankiales bacterium]